MLCVAVRLLPLAIIICFSRQTQLQPVSAQAQFITRKPRCLAFRAPVLTSRRWRVRARVGQGPAVLVEATARPSQPAPHARGYPRTRTLRAPPRAGLLTTDGKSAKGACPCSCCGAHRSCASRHKATSYRRPALTLSADDRRDDPASAPLANLPRADPRAEDAGGMSGSRAGHGGVGSTLTKLSAQERARLTELARVRQYAHIEKVRAERRAMTGAASQAAGPQGRARAEPVSPICGI